MSLLRTDYHPHMITFISEDKIKHVSALKIEPKSDRHQYELW